MDRRRFFKAGAVLSGLLAIEFAPWHSIAAVAREVDDFVRGPALRDHPLRQVSPHVWMIHSPDGFPTPENQGMMCNLTFIDTAQGLVVVDSGARCRSAKWPFARSGSSGRSRWWPSSTPTITAITGWATMPSSMPTVPSCRSMPIPAPFVKSRVQGKLWRTLLEQWTNQATMGTRIVPPRLALEDGGQLRFGDVTLRLHHFGTAHTPTTCASKWSRTS
jgi:hypothetical protein